MNVRVRVALSTQCVLGEGLHWDGRRELLWFVDIYGPHVYWYDPDTEQLGRRTLPEPVGWVLSIQGSDRVLVGLKSGIARLDAFDDSARIEWVDRHFPNDADQRLNDAKADNRGRLWYGSVSATDESKPVGCLARYDADEAIPVIVDSGYTVTNGPAFRSDGTVMLHNDSGQRLTYRYDIDPETGATSNRSTWKQFAEEDGFPDGMSFDADGCVWIAHWGSGKVCRYNLRGDRLLEIQMPTSNITNVCFGGDRMSRIFVTSASHTLNDAERQSEPHAGDVFEISGLTTTGLPSLSVRI